MQIYFFPLVCIKWNQTETSNLSEQAGRCSQNKQTEQNAMKSNGTMKMFRGGRVKRYKAPAGERWAADAASSTGGLKISNGHGTLVCAQSTDQKQQGHIEQRCVFDWISTADFQTDSGSNVAERIVEKIALI